MRLRICQDMWVTDLAVSPAGFWFGGVGFDGVVRIGRALTLFHPGDKLAAAWVAIVSNKPWPMLLDLGEG
jgi:hypothetical protein